METPKTNPRSAFVPPSVPGGGVMDAFPFLAPHDVAPQRARMMLPDGRVTVVEQVPDWYWHTSDRFVGMVTAGLRGDVYLYTYFTCEEEEDGTLFLTVVMTPDDRAEWTVLARSRDRQEAREVHGTIRSAWWVGDEAYRYPRADSGLQVPRPEFLMPLHPLDNL
jgi:hypothetical protein